MEIRTTTNNPQQQKPLTGRYAKLRDDIKAALEAGRAAEAQELQHNGDSGACNFDSLLLILPRWSAEKVKQAVKEAGASADKLSMRGAAHWVIDPDSHCQAGPRSAGAKAMRDCFRALGYDAFMYRQMD